MEGLQLSAQTPRHATSSHPAAAAVEQQDVAHDVSLQAGEQLFLGGSQCQAAMGEDESAACGVSSSAVQLHLCGEKCLEATFCSALSQFLVLSSCRFSTQAHSYCTVELGVLPLFLGGAKSARLLSLSSEIGFYF